jgi:hypothetical protein
MRFSRNSTDDEIGEFSREIEKLITMLLHGIAHFAVLLPEF